MVSTKGGSIWNLAIKLTLQDWPKFLYNCSGNSEDMKNGKEPNPKIIGDVYIQSAANITHALWLDQTSVLVKKFKWQSSYENVQTVVKVTKTVSYLLEHIPKVHKKAKNFACARCDYIFCWNKCPGNYGFELLSTWVYGVSIKENP